MKKTVILFVMFLAACPLFARYDYDNVRSFEFELGAGGTVAFNRNWGSSPVGLNLMSELRYNIPTNNFDVAFQFMLGSCDWAENESGYSYDVRYKSLLVTFVDYNWRKWKNFSIFAGMGLGYGAIDATFHNKNAENVFERSDTSFDRSFILNPRAGIELFDHLRLTAEFKYLMTGNPFAGLNVGFVFGGGKRK